jgi:DNA polymerase IIIc chi subunit
MLAHKIPHELFFMEKPTDQTAILMNRLQEREREQILILSISHALSEAVTKKEFNTVVSGILKEKFSLMILFWLPPMKIRPITMFSINFCRKISF